MFVRPGKFAKAIILLLVPLIFVALSGSPGFARGFGGGIRSFGGGSRFHMPSRSGSSLFSRGFSWGGASRSSGLRTSGRRGFSAWGSSSRFGLGTGGATMSKADKALFERARTRGTAFSNRGAALKAFEQKTGETSRTTSVPGQPAGRRISPPTPPARMDPDTRWNTGPDSADTAITTRPWAVGCFTASWVMRS